MDLVLNNLQRLICHKTQTTNQPSLYKCPGYDTKQSDGVFPVLLELWGMQSTPSLPLLPSPLRVVAPDRGLSIG